MQDNAHTKPINESKGPFSGLAGEQLNPTHGPPGTGRGTLISIFLRTAT